MVITISRLEGRRRLGLRTGEDDPSGYEATIGPGESALGYTYEEWEAALGSGAERTIDLAEDGILRPASDELDTPADGHA